MKRKAKATAEFDVTEFLRPDDADLRSALASLMGPGPEAGAQEEALPGANLNLIPGLNSESGLSLVPGSNLRPGLNLIPDVKVIPGINLGPGLKLGPGPELEPLAERKRQYPVRRAVTAEEGHSRGEQSIYEAMWRDGEAQADGSRLLRIGMLGLARRAGMSESNARMNLRGLFRKLAVEEETGYVCEAGQGRTWRVFSPEQVLERRRGAGMEFYRKRTLAVVFEPNGGMEK